MSCIYYLIYSGYRENIRDPPLFVEAYPLPRAYTAMTSLIYKSFFVVLHVINVSTFVYHSISTTTSIINTNNTNNTPPETKKPTLHLNTPPPSPHKPQHYLHPTKSTYPLPHKYSLPTEAHTHTKRTYTRFVNGKRPAHYNYHHRQPPYPTIRKPNIQHPKF